MLIYSILFYGALCNRESSQDALLVRRGAVLRQRVLEARGRWLHALFVDGIGLIANNDAADLSILRSYLFNGRVYDERACSRVVDIRRWKLPLAFGHACGRICCKPFVILCALLFDQKLSRVPYKVRIPME